MYIYNIYKYIYVGNGECKMMLPNIWHISHSPAHICRECARTHMQRARTNTHAGSAHEHTKKREGWRERDGRIKGAQHTHTHTHTHTAYQEQTSSG